MHRLRLLARAIQFGLVKLADFQPTRFTPALRILMPQTAMGVIIRVTAAVTYTLLKNAVGTVATVVVTSATRDVTCVHTILDVLRVQLENMEQYRPPPVHLSAKVVRRESMRETPDNTVAKVALKVSTSRAAAQCLA